MKFVDLQKEYSYFSNMIQKNVETVLSSGKYLFGEQSSKLENYFKELTEKKYAITVKNCTDAIMLILRCVYKKGMPIILPNFGAYPTAVACRNYTDLLYYVDVDNSMTIDVNKLPDKVKNGILVVVHLFGNNCKMDEIIKYAKTNNHIVIEDCAQSTGSGSGKQGNYSVFSFYPTKPLSSMGDGGIICTDVDGERLRILRFYGQNSNKIDEVGINSRMDEFQCAVVNAKVPGYIDLTKKREEIAQRYKNIVKGIQINSNCVYHQFVLRFRKREEILAQLELQGIPYLIHYPYHVSEMKPLKGKYNKVNFRVNHEVVSLPCHPFMIESEIKKVGGFLYEFRKYEVL